MMEFKQYISDRDYKKAIAIHYFGYKYTYISPILGLIILLGSIFGIIFNLLSKDNDLVIMFILALILIIRPILYIQNVFKSIKTNTESSGDISIIITDDDKIITQGNHSTSSVNLKNLYYYYNTKTYLYLYLARNQYLILDKRQMTKEQIENFFRILERLEIKKR